MTKARKIELFESLVESFKETIRNWVEWGGEEDAPFSEFESMIRGTAGVQYDGIELTEEEKDCLNNDMSVSGALKEILESALSAVKIYW